MDPVVLASLALVVLVLVAGLLAFRRVADPVSVRTLETVARTLGQLQSELSRLSRVQDEMRHEAQRAREASLLRLAEATQGLRGEIGQTQRALVEVKALEEGRARQMERAAESLRRVEAVLSGSGSRGAAGENILDRAFAQLPPDLLQRNVAFGSRVVEYALRLPAGRFLPIDSKWTSAAALERLATSDDAAERRRLGEQVARDVRLRIREVSKYLDPERTLSLALLAVPDAVYVVCPEVHGDGHREGVLVVPYSLALPYVLAVYRLALRFGASLELEPIAARLRILEDSLRRLDDEVEGRLSRGLVQVENARDAMRTHLRQAHKTATGLIDASEPVLPPALGLADGGS
jgi:DNA recombination protein RmuC